MQSAVLAYLHLRPFKASYLTHFSNFENCRLNGVAAQPYNYENCVSLKYMTIYYDYKAANQIIKLAHN